LTAVHHLCRLEGQEDTVVGDRRCEIETNLFILRPENRLAMHRARKDKLRTRAIGAWRKVFQQFNASKSLADEVNALLQRFRGRQLERWAQVAGGVRIIRSEEHTSELQSRGHLVCRLL